MVDVSPETTLMALGAEPVVVNYNPVKFVSTSEVPSDAPVGTYAFVASRVGARDAISIVVDVDMVYSAWLSGRVRAGLMVIARCRRVSIQGDVVFVSSVLGEAP